MTEKCDDCGGSGRKITKKVTSAGGTAGYPCPTCKGTGKKPKAAQKAAFLLVFFNCESID